jgi:hypothetical protein
MLTIKEKIVRKFNRKTGEYDKVINLFSKYKVTDDEAFSVGIGAKTNWRNVVIQGPKEKFVLCECNNPIKIYRPEQPVKELPLFFVSRFKQLGLTKIQGASHFVLDGETLIPYTTCGRGRLTEL